MVVNPKTSKTLASHEERLREEEKGVEAIVDEFIRIRSRYLCQVRQADWMLRALVYHMRCVLRHYAGLFEELEPRLHSGVDIVIVRSTRFQEMIYEFDALARLAKRSLDRLFDLIAPSFQGARRALPSEVEEFERGQCNWPLIRNLLMQPDLEYLVAIRQLIGRYWPFAFGKECVVIREGSRAWQLFETEYPALDAQVPFCAAFRDLSQTEVGVNVYLPDVIFEDRERSLRNRGGRLRRFDFAARTDLLEQSMRFVKLAGFSLRQTLVDLKECPEASFVWRDA